MPSIPEFQRQKFASSVVGTPGEDRSGQMIGQSVARAAGQLEDAAFKMAVTRQRTMDESLANKVVTEARIKADAIAAQADVDFANWDGSPEDRAAQERIRYEEAFSSLLEPVKSPGARRILESEFSNMTGTYTINAAKKGRINQSVLAAKNTLESVNLLSADAANVARNRSLSPTQQFMAIQGLLQQGESAYQSGFEAYSVEDRLKLVQQIPESISKSFLSNLISYNPEDVKGFIESGQFDKVLSEPERKKYLDDAVAAIPKFREKMELDRLYNAVSSDLGLFEAFANDDPNLMQMLEESESPFAEELRDLNLKGAVDPEDKDTAILDLQARIDGMTDFTEKGKPISKKARLEDLATFMKDVVSYRKRGLITDSMMTNYRTKVAGPMYQAILNEGKPSANAGALGSALNVTTLGMAGKMANWWFAKNAKLDDPRARAIIQKAYLSAYDPQKIQTEADAKDLARQVLLSYAETVSPAIGMLDAAPAKSKKGETVMTVQPGPGQAKAQAQVSSKGLETKMVKSKDGKTTYLVTFRDGKPIDKRVADA